MMLLWKIEGKGHYQIQEICMAFKFSNKVQARTIMFFKNFYQKCLIIEHDPKKIMLMCIYVTCLVEDNFVSAKKFRRALQEDLDMFYEYKILVVKRMEFNLIV